MFINFSDAAKFADIARNLILGLGYGGNFTFWDASLFSFGGQNVFSAIGIPPIMPFTIAAFFKIFGVNDFAVVATSFFYFIFTLIFVFLLAKKIFKSNLVGILSTLAVGFNYNLIHYATSGASESPFIFEIVAASYFASLKKKWATAISFSLLVFSYFTRPQAFIYIIGIIFYWLLASFKPQKAVVIFAGVLVVGLLVDYFVLMPLAGKHFLYSITGRGIRYSFNQSSTASDALRGAAVVAGGGIVQTLKNIFYNLYNFYKLLPQIMSPYLFGMFAIGLFIKSKNREVSSFKIASVFMFAFTFIVAAASIPFFRYLHPVVPLIYIVAVAAIVEITKTQITNYKLMVLGSCILVFVFGVGQTLGVFLLDSRFEAKTHNVGKPPVYVVLSQILKTNTNPNQVVITNLDTWGSWYGERKTVWFPLEPDQLTPSEGKEIFFDAIYLTSYLMDDENYYMGEKWRQIFYNPEDPENTFIAENYELKEIIVIDGKDVYEKQDARAVLLVKKSN